jgi:hypothetical protein
MLDARFRAFAGATAAASFVVAIACSDTTSPPSSQPESAVSVTRVMHDEVFGDRVNLRPESGQVTATQPVFGNGNVHQLFSSVKRACLIFRFSRQDLLDPGDELSIRVDGQDGGGFLNVGAEPQGERKLCWVRRFHPEMMRLFLDGKANLKFRAVSGSFKFRAVILRIAGIPR